MARSDSRDPPDMASADLLDEVMRAIAALEAHPDAAVREAAGRLLSGIDAVHRAGLAHLVQALRAMGGDALLNRLVADPAIRLLLMSYDLIAVDRRLQAEEAMDAVRGHLHDHGLDVELLDVVGGVVYVQIHARPESRPDDLDAARRDLEAALAADLVGFQELVVGERAPQGATTAVVPFDALRRARRPTYTDVAEAAEIAPGTMKGLRVGHTPVLVANVEGEFHAVRNQCGDSPLPLDLGALEGAVVVCPWHGCRYDVRSGCRGDGPGERLHVFPVSVSEGRVRVALDVAAGVN